MVLRVGQGTAMLRQKPSETLGLVFVCLLSKVTARGDFLFLFVPQGFNQSLRNDVRFQRVLFSLCVLFLLNLTPLRASCVALKVSSSFLGLTCSTIYSISYTATQMLAVVSSSPPQNVTPHHPNGASTQEKRGKRFLRRRGRGRGELSDDEVEREALTDSDFSSEATESAHETDEEDEKGPSHTSPLSGDVSGPKDRSVRSTAPSPPSVSARLNGHSTLIPPTTDIWSGVASGGIHAVDMPTIQFDQMDAQVGGPSTEETKAPPKRKNRRKDVKTKIAKSATAPADPIAVESPIDAPTEVATVSVTVAPTPRPPKVNARQAYLERLSNDPSFVPRVGAFWGHDERLMDKDLRSMSGWWRGRWQGRGRGGFGLRGRGRGRGGNSSTRLGNGETGDAADGDTSGQTGSAHIPPVEQSWKHDGFEELDRDERRSGRHRFNSSRASRQGSGRGRSRAVADAPPTTEEAPTNSGRSRSPNLSKLSPLKRSKPERAWTKPLDKTLVTGLQSKSNGGSSPTDVRIKLSNTGEPRNVPLLQPLHNRPHSQLADPIDGRSEVSVSEKPAVVRLPGKRVPDSSEPKEPEPQGTPLRTQDTAEPEPAITKTSTPPPDATKQPHTTLDIEAKPNPETPPRPNGPDTWSAADPQEPEPHPVSPAPGSDKPVHAENHDTAPPSPPTEVPPSHSYPESRYSPYLPLPAGVAISENGVLYEIATGRPVILTPPPQPIYDPRSAPFYAPHPHPYRRHSHSLTADFVPPVSTPPIPPGVHSGHFGYSGYDSPQYPPYAVDGPREATPPFNSRRQSRAVEIRAPSRAPDTNGKVLLRPSNLRSSVSADTQPEASEDAIPVYQPDVQMMQPYPGAPFYPVAYPAYTPMHQYTPDGQPYGYYTHEMPYPGYAVPGQMDGGVGYGYEQYPTRVYAPPEGQGVYY
ncbi:uncharacterized protein EI90DRAFT_3040111 [Cantharellus anzutake]|uniref:uncharacterized protein n=1 Tax=Cantharellus anzutake TaxID=1750568 RepID=UPI001904B9D1|nr:uncharacterized protein EI90DRAFT_3040111 [Cantharellus anzutake]KAF8339046.1 hypothetical protein EI90DRAFT_3040111 [Cantharellus anzutake]